MIVAAWWTSDDDRQCHAAAKSGLCLAASDEDYSLTYWLVENFTKDGQSTGLYMPCREHDRNRRRECGEKVPTGRTAEFRAADMREARRGDWRAVEHGFEDSKTPNVQLRRPDGARKDSMSTEHKRRKGSPRTRVRPGSGKTTWRGCTKTRPRSNTKSAATNPPHWRLTWGDYASCARRRRPTRGARHSGFEGLTFELRGER